MDTFPTLLKSECPIRYRYLWHYLLELQLDFSVSGCESYQQIVVRMTLPSLTTIYSAASQHQFFAGMLLDHPPTHSMAESSFLRDYCFLAKRVKMSVARIFVKCFLWAFYASSNNVVLQKEVVFLELGPCPGLCGIPVHHSLRVTNLTSNVHNP